MILKNIVASLIFLCATCCPEDDCAAVLCEGPPSLAFNIELENTNVFLSETYTLEELTITGDNADDFTLTLETFNTEEPQSVLVLQNFNWTIGTSENSLVLEENIVIPLDIQISISESDGCCGGIPRLESLLINGVAQEGNNGIYTISLD